MEDAPLAHYLVVRALEERAGVDARTRFALAIRHAVSGHLPHARYRDAAILRRRQGAGEGAVERSIADWMSTDLNPVVRSISSLRSHANALWAYNAYNGSAALGARTSVDFVGHEPSAAVRLARREPLAPGEDPELCAVGTLSALGLALAKVSRNARRIDPRAPGILDVGRLLGVESSAAFQVAEAFANGFGLDLEGAARALGSSRRSLQRRLAEESTSFEAIKGAARIVAATDMLRFEATLAEVAWSCGFSDPPHLTRALKAACGMTPGLLRTMLRGGAEPLAELRLTAPEFPRPPWRIDSTDISSSQGTMPPGPANARASNRRDEE